ncbi:MAG: transglycosylase SLT domain-containing protein [Candidatus Paracaedibacteraceae bacterium]|nr:transglycosylase SLT domain-containing protein [Candidatus Paracaedibacteraceae bacterium]
MKKTVGMALGILIATGFVNCCATTLKQQSVERIRKVEREKGIDIGLLEAIAKIESEFSPYVVNACGRGYTFKSAAEAAKFVKEKQKQGYRNISVGLMQLHVPSHQHHFKSLEQMCEIEPNVAYSAKLFKKLKRNTGSNEAAVERYHSPDPAAQERYKTRVFGAWAKIKLKRKNELQPINTSSKVLEIKSEKKVMKSNIRPTFSAAGMVRKKIVSP